MLDSLVVVVDTEMVVLVKLLVVVLLVGSGVAAVHDIRATNEARPSRSSPAAIFSPYTP